MKTLVVGCDASGKSTLLEAIQLNWNDTLAESTGSEEARTFRRANHRRIIDADFISERENMYLALSHRALLQANTLVSDSITTDSSLVTRLSHSTMRQVINEPFLATTEIIKAWQNDVQMASSKAPDLFVHTYANPSVIIARMIERQAGDTLEHFWGFNTPLFLEAYQKRWHGMISELSKASFRCISFDTGAMSVDECLVHYSKERQDIITYTAVS